MIQEPHFNVPDFIASRRRATQSVPIRNRSGRARRLTVACVLDEFSFNSFSPEADFAPLTMRDWHAEITAAQPDLLLVESAWRGFRETWWNTVPKCGPQIRGILDWCAERGIPTAFWNKEDPVHFGTFLNLASQFDVVFTTDLDCVPRYKARLAHDRVHFLPFAAQPLTHNPIELFDRIDGCAFAGAYYMKYPHRNRALDEISGALEEVGRFDIYDRNFAKPHPDHTFPDRYQQHIVGGLQPEEIDVAYKGYTTNLNLNSVQESQSMFARRVFELLASNTLVVSNFARGLRLMFGDLVMTVSGADELHRRIDDLENITHGAERLRNQAFRKVMSEHSYSERLTYIAEACGIALDANDSVVPAIVSEVRIAEERDRVVAMATAQSTASWRLVLWGEAAAEVSAGGVQVIAAETAAEALAAAQASGATHIGAWSAADWYGPGYIGDLVETLRWADVSGVGHVERWVNTSGALVRHDAGKAWSIQRTIPLTRGVVRIDGTHDFTSAVFEGIAVSTLDYCEGGAELSDSALAPASRINLDEGLSLRALREHADTLSAADELRDETADVPLEQVMAGIKSRGGVSVELDDDGRFAVVSTLESSTHDYLYSTETLGLDLLPGDEQESGHFVASPGLEVMLVVVYLDGDGNKLSHTMMPNGKNVAFHPPTETHSVRFGLRVSGSGETRIERFSRAPQQIAPQPLVLRSESLLVTNIYPSYEQLYRNGFVASRVRSYRSAGLRLDVAIVNARADSPTYREFRDVDVATIPPAVLKRTIADSGVRHVLVHFLDSTVRDALRDTPSDVAVTIWVHGFEVQPWHRRAFQYDTEEELEIAKAHSAERMAMWAELFQSSPKGWHFVFISKYLAEQVFKDIGMRLPNDAYSIIHNPIDTEVFRYREKEPDHRYRILSLRPYASNVYANDLAVAAVLRLQQTRPDFDKFQFAFYGDGPLFESVTAPLNDFENVELHRRFLTQEEIAELHRDYGVFLTPSRMDTQGVSRGEAMASGLVPIASDVAAVPEFVDDDSGILVPEEDAEGLAAAMARLADDPELFLRLSRGAAARVSEQVASQTVIGQELNVIQRP